MLAVEAEGVPVELTNLDRWCLWRLTTRDGKSTKQPFQTSGEPAKSNYPATWDTFDSVVAEYARRPGHWSGIGFVFSADDPFCGIDLDGCRNATTGELAPWAKRIVDHFATYSEISPSGTGVKLWVIGQWRGSGHKKILAGLPLMADKQPAIEVYDSLRYFAVTGRSLAEGGGGSDHVTADQAGLDLIHEQFFAASERPKKATSAVTTGTSSSPQGQGRDVLINRASAYLAKVPPSISGQDGSGAALRAACELFRFGLTDGEARDLFDDFNARCQPPWSDHEIDHKLESARDKVVKDGEFGARVSQLGGTAPKRSNRKRTKEKRSNRKPATEISFPILAKLQSVERGSATAWKATCPLCYGQSTLSVSLDGSGGANKAEVLCSAGCDPIELLIAAGCLQSDLYVELVPIKSKEPAAGQPSAGHTGQANEADNDPHRLSRLFIDQNAIDDQPTIRFWRGQWYRWHDGFYDPLETEEIRCRVVACIKTEFDRINVEQLKTWIPKEDEDEKPQAMPVTVTAVGSVLQALRSECLLPNSIEAPSLLADDGLTGSPAKNLVSLRNGVLDLGKFLADEDDVLLPHSPRLFTLAALPIDFDADAKCPIWEKFRTRNLADDDRCEMLQEWFGVSMTFNNSFQAFLMLQGEGSNGKSVICSVLTAFLGLRNVSHVPLECFGETFHLSGTIGKLANVVSEIGEVEKANEGTLKSYTSGDRMTFNRKNLPLFEAVPTARLVMSTNRLPHFADRSNGVWRRMLLLPLDVVIEKSEKVAGMDSAEWWSARPDELSGMLLWALEGLARLTKNRGFTEPKSMKEGIAEYQLECFPARRFLADTYEENPDGEVSTIEVYQLYRKWCEENGHKKFQASHTFGREIKKTFPIAKAKRWVLRHDGTRGYGYTGIEMKADPLMTPEIDEEKEKENLFSLFE